MQLRQTFKCYNSDSMGPLTVQQNDENYVLIKHQIPFVHSWTKKRLYLRDE